VATYSFYPPNLAVANLKFLSIKRGGRNKRGHSAFLRVGNGIRNHFAARGGVKNEILEEQVMTWR